jgi:hypothetical protein
VETDRVYYHLSKDERGVNLEMPADGGFLEFSPEVTCGKNDVDLSEYDVRRVALLYSYDHLGRRVPVIYLGVLPRRLDEHCG